MLEILDSIDKVKKIPDELDSLIQEKNFQKAQKQLSQAFEIAEKNKLWSLPALNSIKFQLQTQESNLFGLLVEELHNHLYFKSPYTQYRWCAVRKTGSSSGSGGDNEKFQGYLVNNDTSSGSTSENEFERFLKKFQKENLTSEQMLPIPETDSFAYIQMLLETINSLNKLPAALESINRRLPMELNKLVNRCIIEIKQRYPNAVTSVSEVTRTSATTFGPTVGSKTSILLQDLFYTTLSKLLGAFQAFRVILEVVTAIYQKSGSKKQSMLREMFNSDFIYVWKSIESEVRSLLYSYITDSISTTGGELGHIDSRGRSNSTISRHRNNKPKPLYSLEKVELSEELVKNENEQLLDLFKNLFPGLPVSSGNNKKGVFIGEQNETKHEVLVTPDPFNMRVLWQGISQFVEKSKSIFPAGLQKQRDHIEVFIDQFMTNVFQPQLEDSLWDVFNSCIDTSDAFTFVELPGSGLHVFKNTQNFMEMISRVCKVLNTGSNYREMYTSLIVKHISKFIQKYSDYYSECLGVNDGPNNSNTTSQNQLIRLLNISDLTTVSSNLIGSAKEQAGHLVSAEMELLLTDREKESANLLNPETGVSKGDILDAKSFESLCYLVSSGDWVIQKLKTMKRIHEEKNDPTTPGSGTVDQFDILRKKWSLLELSRSANISQGTLEYLTLAGDSLKEFEEIIAAFENLTHSALLALRYDLVIRAAYYISRVTAEGRYSLPTESEERDVHICEMDWDLILCNEKLSSILGSEKKFAVLLGLPDYVDKFLVIGAENIKQMNGNGVKKFICNILILRQMLRAIMSRPEDVDFSKSLAFYEQLKKNLK